MMCGVCCETGRSVARMESGVGVGATVQIPREDYLSRPAAYNPMTMESEGSEMSSVPMAICTRTRETPLNISELVNSYIYKGLNSGSS